MTHCNLLSVDRDTPKIIFALIQVLLTFNIECNKKCYISSVWANLTFKKLKWPGYIFANFKKKFLNCRILYVVSIYQHIYLELSFIFFHLNFVTCHSKNLVLFFGPPQRNISYLGDLKLLQQNWLNLSVV
jgi:hypothetical protein